MRHVTTCKTLLLFGPRSNLILEMGAYWGFTESMRRTPQTWGQWSLDLDRSSLSVIPHHHGVSHRSESGRKLRGFTGIADAVPITCLSLHQLSPRVRSQNIATQPTVGQINLLLYHCVSHLLPIKEIWQKFIFIFFAFGYHRWLLSSVAVTPPVL